MNVRKASIAFTEPAPLARHRRPKLLPEAIQGLSEGTGAGGVGLRDSFGFAGLLGLPSFDTPLT